MELRFGEASQFAQTHTNLSAIRRDPTGLWVAGDETATIEHLTWTGDHFGDERTFALADYVDLPAGRHDEADIEGLARADGHLWAVGSHSLKRRKAKPGDPGKSIKRLGTVVREENRFILVRLPLDPAADRPLPGAILSEERNIAAHLADDRHLAPFLALPGKDNGLDIEGIAVVEDRVYLGLRGPVLRGWAVVLELRPVDDGDGRLRLDGPYRKHFLDLDGLGVRDMCPHGGDLLLLTGPTMNLDGPVRVVRWRERLHGGLVPAHELETLLELPYGVGCDHPEGLAVVPDGRLMVVYDSPSPARITPAGGVLADLFTI
ncbi:MAG: DUF3616 domain-containing protein [Nonomuraea sp.]|nr:DUF3616 domain-containing protein [Nonomuraea sp.]NUP67365.1 DUF3616 domain-containing protein [Nonomuraea sp.]NUP76329.1 DUF3616 domain-containing protein [Nonomuraea sp.]NUS04611.1 DUF3616 domain-containing protein [Nonomuraea sp.]NUT39447.1 DUF3616 domain-containing protein [Thermoactinospora sp.]